MTRPSRAAPIADLEDAVRNLRRDVDALQAHLRRSDGGVPKGDWACELAQQFVPRVAEIRGVAAIAAWAEGEGLTVVTLMEGYDIAAEYRVIDIQVAVYAEHLSHIPIDFQIRAPGPELQDTLDALRDDILWRRE